MSKIWVNVDEETWKFLGAYSSKELAFSACIASLDSGDGSPESTITFEYEVVEGSISKKDLTVEDILNGKNEE